MNGTTAIAADASMVQEVVRQVGRRIVGQDYMVERLMISLLTGGHVLLEGVPGLAKTLTVRTLAETINTSFSRIQFTPDLLPADVVGTQIYDQSNGKFSVKKGPIFANIILADEINRAPAKVQAALLEAMQEKQVTIGGTTHILEEPFLVLATQNPIEQEGTYPLPEAQVDRFMLKLHVGYPTREEEKEVLRRMASGEPIPVDQVATPKEILETRHHISELYIDERVVDYIVEIVHATRNPDQAGLA
ncbi:MAG TPA: AAA family ATPase, partial [Gemmatimonadaceae bacterium]|nr:AAA family ATPase [Gemmatimonadaceae bacterium]